MGVLRDALFLFRANFFHALQVAREHIDLEIDRPSLSQFGERGDIPGVRDDVECEMRAAVVGVGHTVDRQRNAVDGD